jgi:DNA-binding protein HU-beta
MINRTIIGKEIAHQLGLVQAQGDYAVNRVFEMIAEELRQGEGVRLKDFGTFAVRHHPAREGRNPSNGEKIAIAASVGVSFKPHRALKDALNPDRPGSGGIA